MSSSSSSSSWSPWKQFLSSWLHVVMQVLIYSTILPSLSEERSCGNVMAFQTRSTEAVTITSRDGDLVYTVTTVTSSGSEIFDRISITRNTINIIFNNLDGTFLVCLYSRTIDATAIEVTSCTRDLVVPSTYNFRQYSFVDCDDDSQRSITINSKCLIMCMYLAHYYAIKSTCYNLSQAVGFFKPVTLNKIYCRGHTLLRY